MTDDRAQEIAESLQHHFDQHVIWMGKALHECREKNELKLELDAAREWIRHLEDKLGIHTEMRG